MSTASTATIATAASFATPPHLTFLGVARSEVRKFFSLRSLVITTGVALLAGIGLPVAIVAGLGSEIGPSDATNAAIQVAVQLQSLVLLAIGVLIVSNEFTKNAVITTFVTVPRRLMVMAAKFLVLILIVVVNWAVAITSAATMSLIQFGEISFDSEATRIAQWSGFYLFFFAALGFTLAMILRSSAGAITSGVALIYIVQIPFLMMSSSVPWAENVANYLPFMLVNHLFTPIERAPFYPLTYTGAALVLACYLAVFGAIGALLIKRRDIN